MAALGKARAGEELARAAELDDQRLAAFGAAPVGLLGGDLLLVDLLLLLLEQGDEGLPELAQHRPPLLLAAGDGVEILLQLGGEVVVDVAGEVVDQQVVDHPADVLGEEGALLQAHVLAGHQGVHDRGVGGGAADAVLLQGLDQARLGEARRRLGEVLLGEELRAA